MSYKNVACGCDIAISLRVEMLDDHSSTLKLTNSFMYSSDPIAAPR